MKKRLFLVLLSILILFTATCIRFSRYYGVSCETYVNNGMKGTISKNINKLLCNTLITSGICYEEIATINRNSKEEIESIVIESTTITMLANKLSDCIYNEYSGNDYEFGIPLGNALGSKIFSGRGPKINIKVAPLGTVEYEIISELQNSGINQTLHRIGIKFTAELQCIAPFNESVLTIENEIILAETLIIGKVPNTLLPTW